MPGDSLNKTDTADERRDRMLALWGETLAVFRARLKADKELSASYMATVTAFLAQSGISAESVDEAREAVEDLATAQLLKDIEEATRDTTPAPEKVPVKPTGAPLDQPFEPRPPRT